MFFVRVIKVLRCYIKSRLFSIEFGSLVLFYKISRWGINKFEGVRDWVFLRIWVRNFFSN